MSDITLTHDQYASITRSIEASRMEFISLAARLTEPYSSNVKACASMLNDAQSTLRLAEIAAMNEGIDATPILHNPDDKG